jgi:hypothetical protein
MRFAILPLVIHRKSQFGPAGNDVLIQVAPFRCTFSVPNNAVQAFLQAIVPCRKARTVLSGPRLPAVNLSVFFFRFCWRWCWRFSPLAHFLSVTRCRSPEECASWYSITPKDAERSAENICLINSQMRTQSSNKLRPACRKRFRRFRSRRPIAFFVESRPALSIGGGHADVVRLLR